jgi:GAF domain-containing protein
MSDQTTDRTRRDPGDLTANWAPIPSEPRDATEHDLPLSVFTAVLEDLFVAGAEPLQVVLRHALLFVDAASAALSLPIGPDLLEIRAVTGLAAGQLIGQSFPRSTSVAGHVIDTGKPEVVDQFVPQFAEVEISQLGPAIVVPLRAGTPVVGALSLARLRESPPFTASDVELVSEFAELAGVALHLDQARINREATLVGAERDRIASTLRLSVIRELSDVMLQIDRVTGALTDVTLRAQLFKTTEQIHALIKAIRDTIYRVPAERPDAPSN